MSSDFSHVRFISAGAGSGKTYRLTEEVEDALVRNGVKPHRVIGTTFTVKAAGEIRERVRERLIRAGRPQLAEQMAQALIGTVHSVCERLLKRFAFEMGLSPELHVVSLEDCTSFFNQALDDVLSTATVRTMNDLAHRLDMANWRGHVEALANRARNNDIGPDTLPAMGVQSADELLAFFPDPKAGAWDATLLETVKNALHSIDLTVDTTKATAGYCAVLKDAIYQLRRMPCPWAVWIRLSKGKSAKKSEPIAAKVREAASAYEAHPGFQEDIRAYIEGIYDVAARALQRFQAIKTERGLIDFTDMEQLALRALDDPTVRERLDEELELLLVDEFQDTNPMQLAIFMKLAELADKVIFVGDVKQAIYAFRGCDSDLVFDTLLALTARGGEADVLKKSWRSRPALVRYINAVFAHAFDGEIPSEQVTLEPVRTEETGEPAALRWTLEGKAAERAEALALAVGEFVNSGYKVVDPDTGAVRPVQWGDIAVLAATNPHVDELAQALRSAHVPMKMTLTGLLGVADVCLAKACLRRLNDPTDTLATAEIIAMSDCTEPEVWLADRLQWLKEEQDGYAWAEATHAIISKLKILRAQTATQSPVEVVARVLNYIGIREVVTAWGPDAIKAAQRQRNLDALLQLAVEYENHCDSQHVAATLTGFLYWLENPHSPELDLQPVVTTGNAVHVLTYHRAKGLEWPVVINTDFHYRWRHRIWDIRVEGPEGVFDLHHPLAGRVVRFWPQIFGDHSKGIPVLDKIMASAEGLSCIEKGKAENRRLAYVGMTRARDATILAIRSGNPKSDAWIHAFECEYLLPEGETLALPDGQEIPTAKIELTKNSGMLEPLSFTPRWFAARTPLIAPQKEGISPSRIAPVEGTTIQEVVELGERIPLHGGDMTVVGSALHAIIAAELVNPDRGNRLSQAESILEGYGIAPYLSASAALDAARRLHAWIDQRFEPLRILAEHPITHVQDDGRVARGWIDVLLETKDGWVIIDHKSSPRPRSNWAREVIEYSGQLCSYRNALEAAGRSVVGTWLHFPVGGGAVLTSS